jgi:hypothetical protein
MATGSCSTSSALNDIIWLWSHRAESKVRPQTQRTTCFCPSTRTRFAPCASVTSPAHPLSCVGSGFTPRLRPNEATGCAAHALCCSRRLNLLRGIHSAGGTKTATTRAATPREASAVQLDSISLWASFTVARRMWMRGGAGGPRCPCLHAFCGGTVAPDARTVCGRGKDVSESFIVH